MPLDPAIAAQVAHLFDTTLAQVLAGEVQTVPPAAPMRRDEVHVSDGEVPGFGGPVRVRIYRPREVSGALPTLVWAHGGGWTYGDLDMPEADSVAQVVAAEVPAVVVSVDYRLAPEHTHPAALDDVAAATRWALGEGAAHGIDPTRVAVGGASAGAHLAACTGVAMAGRLAAVLLAYPVTDPVDGPYPEVCHPDCPPVIWIDGPAIRAMLGRYLGIDPADAPPAVIPARADLSQLAPVLVTTAECDGLTPQGRRFVELARAAGADATHHHVEGVLHGYLNTVGDSPVADDALARHVDWLRGVFDARVSVGIGPGNY